VDGEEDDLDLFSQLEGVQPKIVVELLKEFHQRFISLKNKCTQTFLEVDSSHSLLVKDLQVTHKHFFALKSKIFHLEDAHRQNVSQTESKLELVSNGVRDQGKTIASLTMELQQLQQGFESLKSITSNVNEELDLRITDLDSTISTLNTKVLSVDRSIKEFDKRFSIIFPILKT